MILKRPMLAVEATLRDIRYPVIASPKLDGVRAVGVGCGLYSRTMKQIPNQNLQHLFSSSLGTELNGWDGELIEGDPTHPNVMQKTMSSVMTHDGPATAIWYLFDYWNSNSTFAERYLNLPREVLMGGQVRLLDQFVVNNEEQLLEFEDRTVAKGYEGLILRAPWSPYKQNRSTLREGFMLKLKRFTDAEAQVVGFEEQLHNSNEAKLDERGFTKRSSHAEGKRPMGVLGALVCEMGGVVFRIGTGFTLKDREHIWGHRGVYLGKWAKFKYLPVGIKTAPRHPVFLGWRDPIDFLEE